jgi:hypothetical protein
LISKALEILYNLFGGTIKAIRAVDYIVCYLLLDRLVALKRMINYVFDKKVKRFAADHTLCLVILNKTEHF